MKTKVITTAAVLGITALASLPAPANAAGCLKGALIGGLVGHFAGHGILGAGAGCLALGSSSWGRMETTLIVIGFVRPKGLPEESWINSEGSVNGPVRSGKAVH